MSCLFFVAACSNENQPQKILSTTKKSATLAPLYVDGKDTSQRVPLKIDSSEKTWLPVGTVMEVLHFKSKFDERSQTFQYGDTDPLYMVKADDVKAVAGEKTRILPQAPQLWDNQLYMTTEALSTLLNTEVTWEKDRQVMSISSISLEEAGDGATTKTFANIDGEDLVRFAERFLGVPYDFGSGPYAQTGTFDCSSFVQYVYNHFGVDIPRSSRGQSDVGRMVGTQSLQPGDLLFFYTPGRYNTNKIVGHVGMYAGNDQIIHTYGSPGVTTSQLNGYWEGRLLFAKRL